MTSTATTAFKTNPLVVVAICVVAVLVTMFVFGGQHTSAVAAAIVFEAWSPVLLLACATLGGIALIRPIAGETDPFLFVATGAGVGLVVLVTVSFLLGTAGLLSMAMVAVVLVGMAIAGLAVLLPRVQQISGGDPPKVSAIAWLWILPSLSLGMALVAATMPAGTLWGGEPNGYDVLSYHLQIPAEWHATGRIETLPHNVFSFMPLANEVLFLNLMHLVGGGAFVGERAMYACQMLNVGLGAMTVLAIFGGVRQATGDTLAATVSAVVASCVPWLIMLSSIAYNETIVMLGGAISAAWLLRTIDAPTWKHALLAGLGAGLAASGKYTAVPMLVIGGMAVLAWPNRKRLTAMVVFAIATGAVLLPWLVRNTMEAGNPIFPLGWELLGGPFTELQAERWSRSHALAGDASAIGNLASQVITSPAWAFAFWPIVLIGAYGQPRLRSFFVGSTTSALILGCHAPILLFR